MKNSYAYHPTCRCARSCVCTYNAIWKSKSTSPWCLPDMNDQIRRLGVLFPNIPGCGVVMILLPEVAGILDFEELVRYAVGVSVGFHVL